MLDQTSKEYRQIWFDENFDLIGRANAKQKLSVREYFEGGDINNNMGHPFPD